MKNEKIRVKFSRKSSKAEKILEVVGATDSLPCYSCTPPFLGS